MKRELSILASLAILSSVVYAGDSGTPIAAPVIWDVPVAAAAEATDYFVYLSGGTATANVDSSIVDNIVLLPDVLNDEATIIEGGIGYRHSSDLFATAFIQSGQLDEVSILNYNASVNYRFSDLPIMPYIGAVIGYSTLEWDEIPVDTTGHTNIESKLDADHITYGLQAGADFEITDHFTIFGKYQIMTFDHLMEIFEASDIEHTDFQSLQGGIRYEF